MLIRLSPWGLALLAASSLSSISTAQAQVPDPADVPAVIRPDDAPPTSEPLPRPDAKAIEDDIQERALARSRNRYVNKKVHDADPWKKHPPVWSIRDDSKEVHPYAHLSRPAPGIGHYPGGPTGQFGYPYYYTRTSPDTAYGQVGGGPVAAGYYGPGYGPGGVGGPGYGGPGMGTPGYGAPGMAPGMIGPGMGGPGYGDPGMGGPGYGGPGYGGPGYGPQVGQGYGPGVGTTMAALPGQLPGNPYLYHFGPGFYRHQEAGHYSFPYYSYRRPWYFPGHPSYNRDTNIPW